MKTPADESHGTSVIDTGKRLKRSAWCRKNDSGTTHYCYQEQGTSVMVPSELYMVQLLLL